MNTHPHYHRSRPFAATALAIAALSLLWASPGYALLTILDGWNDAPQCDTLILPDELHEIGWGAATTTPPPPTGTWPFPANQELTSVPFGTAASPPCPVTNQQIADPVIRITNLTGIDMAEVWYVADHDTTITNYDGFITSPTGANPPFIPGGLPGAQLPTFRIDAVGMNRPLLGEGIANDGIWQAGETWTFAIQDYVNVSYAPELINSLGLDSLNVLPTLDSSGSILAIPIPEPGSLTLALLGVVAIVAGRRRRR